MNQRDEIKKIWQECFDDSPEYVDMYFDRVYNDRDAITLERGGHIVSSMLLQRYVMQFHGQTVGMAYVAGAGTKRAARGKGYMTQLMLNALDSAYRRGDMLCALIPAHDWLYFYYDRFDFATVFYVDPQRFTSLHSFPVEKEYFPIDNHYSEEIYNAFRRFEMQRPCTVLHSYRDFKNILDDLHLDRGRFVVMTDETGEIVSMALATESDGMLIVRELLGRDADARTAALHELRRFYKDFPVKVMAPPLDEHRKLYDRGMARIVNVKTALDVIAASHPRLELSIRVTDTLLPVNSNTYRLHEGVCEVAERDKLDLDVNIDVFTRILFSSQKIGGVIGLPSERPVMSLMLD